MAQSRVFQVRKKQFLPYVLHNESDHIRKFHMSKDRLEAFSDGVIAIIITIMVLELRAPQQEGRLGLQTTGGPRAGHRLRPAR